MNELILHHYPGSPYAEKIRLILGFKGLAWRSVEISEVMPRPRLTPLTGGYRRSPVLQIGADVYCDTRLIASRLEALAPRPTLWPDGSRGLGELLAGWAEPRVFLSTGPVRLRDADDVLGAFDARVSPEAFLADRAAFMRPALDVLDLARRLPACQDQLRCFLATLAALLEDGRDFLAGDAPSMADFSAVHTVWWLRRPPVSRGGLDEFPELETWADRVGAFGHGRADPLDAAAALEIARANQPELSEQGDPLDPAARKPGQDVCVRADDYGRDAVTGTLVALSRDHVCIAREHAHVGRIANHFPRIGFEITNTGGERGRDGVSQA